MKKSICFIVSGMTGFLLVLLLCSWALGADDLHFAPGEETRIEHAGMRGHFLVYVPTDYTHDRKWPLIFSYHGYKGQPSTHPFRKVTGGKGFIVVGMDYGSGRYHDHPKYSLAKSEQQHVVSIKKLLDKYLNIDKSMLFMGGVSQGGYSTSVLGETMLDEMSGLVLLASGRSFGVSHRPNLKKLRGKPIFIGAGTKDEVHGPRAIKAAGIYRGWGANVTLEMWPGLGHSVDANSARLRDWLLEYGPLRDAKAQLALARDHEKKGRVVEAYREFISLADCSDTLGVCVQAAGAADALAQPIFAKLTQIDTQLEDRDYAAAFTPLVDISQQYQGTPLGAEARKRIDQLRSDPQISAQIDQMLLDAKAAALRARADDAVENKDYAGAFAKYEQYLSECSGAKDYELVKAIYETLKNDPAVAAALRDQEAAHRCKPPLALAKAYLEAEMVARARPLLEKIIEQDPRTSYATEARQLLESAGSP